jgi:hypothetical protein
MGLNSRPFADEMDIELHRARIESRKKVTYETAIDSLPDGCFVQIHGRAYLVWGDALLLWTPEGYTRADAKPVDSIATVLTPEPIVRCMRNGYKPEVLGTVKK